LPGTFLHTTERLYVLDVLIEVRDLFGKGLSPLSSIEVVFGRQEVVCVSAGPAISAGNAMVLVDCFFFSTLARRMFALTMSNLTSRSQHRLPPNNPQLHSASTGLSVQRKLQTVMLQW
jgi:hypothetical protein